MQRGTYQRELRARGDDGTIITDDVFGFGHARFIERRWPSDCRPHPLHAPGRRTA